MAASLMAGLPALKDTFIQLKTRMEKAVEDFRQHLVGTRTGRASVHMLDNVRVPYYGSEMPLNQVAQVSAPEANLIVIQPFDPSLLPELEKALRTSELGFNPQNDGKIIRLPIPPMTEERRKDVVKQLNKQLEEHRTAIRNIRRDGNDAIKKAAKDKKISEDEEKRSLEEIQKLTDDEIKRIEEMCRAKEKDVMQV
jgi:ribosome recycling factor